MGIFLPNSSLKLGRLPLPPRILSQNRRPKPERTQGRREARADQAFPFPPTHTPLHRRVGGAAHPLSPLPPPPPPPESVHSVCSVETPSVITPQTKKTLHFPSSPTAQGFSSSRRFLAARGRSPPATYSSAAFWRAGTPTDPRIVPSIDDWLVVFGCAAEWRRANAVVSSGSDVDGDKRMPWCRRWC